MANPLGKLFRPLWVRLDKLLSGGAPDDPLYLTNRTIVQKIKSWLVIGIPCLVVLAAVAFALARRGRANDVAKAAPPAAERAAKMLPDYSKILDLGSDRPLLVDEVQVLKTDPPKVIGAATNNSNYVVHSADVVCELETRRGARLGAVTAHLSEIEPHQTKKFEVPIAQNTAYMAVVWEIRIQ